MGKVGEGERRSIGISHGVLLNERIIALRL
jgi:hypothetical protein